MIPRTIEGREYDAFVDCNGKSAKRVNICQNEGETIKVELDYEGIEFVTYDEVSSVAGLATVTVLDYTVAVGKVLTLVLSDVSGDNRGKWRVEKNGNTIAQRRTYYTDYDNQFPLS